MATATPGPSQPVSISGSIPGILDSTQTTRLLSTPDSKLTFATFHPRTASQNPRKLSRGDELCSNKRVVIEILPSGESFWRWVPRAKGVENGGDEGEWPRVVDICGQHVVCSQEQWDIYKLDPEYDCTVHPAPLLATITRRQVNNIPIVEGNLPTRQSGNKRAFVAEDSDDDLPMPGKLKKTRPAFAEIEVEEQADSDDEVEMIVDTSLNSDNVKARRRKLQEGREERRQKLAVKVKNQQPDDVEDLSMIDLTIEPDPPSYSEPSSSSHPPSYASNAPSFSSQPPSYTSNPPSFSSQASGSSPEKAFATKDDFDTAIHSYPKRRTSSPTAHKPSKRARREAPEFAQKKSTRERMRQDRLNGRVQMTRGARDFLFTQSLRASVPPDAFERSESTSNAATQSPTPQPDVPEEDLISLEEKIRRIQEINAYEQARRARDDARLRAEAAEAELRRKQEEARHREWERAERQRLERELEQESRRKQQEEEQARQQRKMQEEQKRRHRQQQEERFSYGPWTTRRALERYNSLAEAFDNARFTCEDPVTFVAVPWPVLHKPTGFTVEDVDWSSVEAFFHTVRSHMRTSDYKTFVEKSHRRFHPDRWRARRVLQSVEDDELRACLEVAANTVAQAITPLWREIKSQ